MQSNSKNCNITGGNNAFIQARHFASTIEVGITDRSELCPWCGGGETQEKSFAVTRISEAEAKYCCHRASCGRAGRIAVWGFRLPELDGPSPSPGKTFTPRLFTSDTYELGDEWASELLELYQITRSEAVGAGWRCEVGTGRLVCPVRSFRGVERGCEVRRSKIQVPYVKSAKTESYRFLEGEWLGWYRTITTGPIVLVEDAISALKVSRHFETVCLHGSHISLGMILEVLEVAGVHRPILCALDKDATNKALKFAAEYRLLAPNFRVVPLDKDLKYVSDEEIIKLTK